MNPHETLLWLGLQCSGFLVMGALVYVLTRILRLQTQPWSFARPQAAALWGLGAVLVGWLLVSILFFPFAPGEAAPQQLTQARSYDPSDVVSEAAIALILLGPPLLALRWRREPWASARVSRLNLGGSLIVGALLALLAVVSVLCGGELNSLCQLIGRLGSRHLWAFLQYAVVGFGEELVFRGYLQTRMVAWLGRWPGWVLASVLMALAQVVQRLTVGGMSPLEALLSSASLIPISLFLGYVMLRTENVVAPGLAHAFADWVGTLSQVRGQQDLQTQPSGTTLGRFPAVSGNGTMDSKGQGKTGRMRSTYEVHLKETLDDCWARRFDDLNISHEDDGTTVLVGPVRDQAALHGLLGRVRDLGLTLLAVACIEPELQAPYSPANRIATDSQAVQNERHTNG